MTPGQIDSQKWCYDFCLSGREKVVFKTITDTEEIMISFVKARSPLRTLVSKCCKNVAGKLTLERTSTHNLVQAAAMTGFAGMTLHHLKLLHQKLKVVSERRPVTVAQYLQALLCNVLPLRTEEERDAIINVRAQGPLQKVTSVLEEGENIELCKDLIDDQEVVELRKKQKSAAKREDGKKYNKPKPAESVLVEAPAASVGAPSSSSASAPPTSKRQKKSYGVDITWDSLQNKDLKHLLPPGENTEVMLTREVKRATRWKAKYPNRVGPRYFSMVYYDKASEQLSVKECLRWLWTCAATEHPGTECPFDIERL
eukprot:1026635-Amphidinium_carterae.1